MAEAEKVRTVRAMFAALDLFMVDAAPGSVCVRPTCPEAPPGDSGTWITLSRVPDRVATFAQVPSPSRDFIVAHQ